MSAQSTNVKIAKFVLLGLILISLAESVRLMWNSVCNYKKLKEEAIDDYFTGDRGEGYYAKVWMISAITVLSITDAISVFSAVGIFRNYSKISIIYGVYMTCVSTYTAYDKYLSKYYSAFILSQIIGIVAIFYSILNYIIKNKDPIQVDAVRELTKPLRYTNPDKAQEENI